MKKTLAIILVLVMAVALFAACGSSSSSNETSNSSNTSTSTNNSSSSGNNASTAQQAAQEARDVSTVDNTVVEHDRPISVRVALTNSVAKFGPDMIVNPYNVIVADGVYERLGERAYYGSTDFVGVLMKSWEAYNDEYSYHIEIYDYIYDQDGNHMTADDVIWCLEMQNTEANKSNARKITEMTKTGDYTLDITFNQNYAGWFVEFCESMWICTQKAFEDAKANNGICAGTGPYKALDFVSNSYLELEKSDFYWQEDESLRAITSRANVDKIRYDIVSEVTQMAIAISDNQTFQLAANVTESLVGDALAAEGSGNGMEVEMIQSTQTKIISFNTTENSLCSNADLRRAICYALNNESCMIANYAGIAFIPETFGIKSLLDWDDSWATEMDYYSYNLDKAKECLEAAGYNPNNAGISLTYFGNQTGENQNNGIWIAGCLSELGIDVNIWLVESASVNNYANDMTAGWDIKESGMTPSNLYNYLYLANMADQDAHGGVTNWGDSTAEMHDRVEKIKAGDMDEFNSLRKEVNEEAYMYYFLGRYFVIVHDENITNIVTNWRNGLSVGACTYSENYDHYAD